MFWQILLLTILRLESGSTTKGWSLVGPSVANARPCKGNENITASIESNLPPDEENQYGIFIKETFPKHSEVKIKFDSEAIVRLDNGTTARISAINGDFYIRFFKNAEYLSFTVKGSTSGVMAYMTSLIVNNVEYCEKPVQGFFGLLPQGIQDTAEVHLSVPDATCGRRQVQHTALITNGLDTKSGDWPWHVAIYRLDKEVIKYICGGTLLSKTFILTAAHCATIRGAPVLPETLSVVLGKYNLIGGDIASQEKEIHQVIIHENFTPERLNNDIALLKMKTEASFGDYVQSACLWYADALKKLPSGQIYGAIVGWGFNQNDTLSSQLKMATIPKVSEATCIKSNPVFYGNILSEGSKFCAGYRNGTSACNGDSGGGFTVFVPDTSGDSSSNPPGAWYVRGIVSLSISRRDVALCDSSQYVVFTDIAKYRGWLKKRVKDL